ncbi:hypothetical protein P7C70_g1034, partial [Phenoliferia sp. Uapishka_3]
MPLHLLYCAPDLYNSDEKHAIAKEITELYVGFGLPAFYANINFIDSENQFIGGERRHKFLRAVVHHLAVTHPDTPEGYARKNIRKDRFMEAYSKLLKRWTIDRGISWEAQVLQTDPLLWRLDGIRPPTIKDTERFKLWVEANKPIPE